MVGCFFIGFGWVFGLFGCVWVGCFRFVVVWVFGVLLVGAGLCLLDCYNAFKSLDLVWIKGFTWVVWGLVGLFGCGFGCLLGFGFGL